MSDYGHQGTTDPWAPYQRPRRGAPCVEPLWAVVMGALAVGVRPDGSVVLVILSAGLHSPHRHNARDRSLIESAFTVRWGGSRRHGNTR